MPSPNWLPDSKSWGLEKAEKIEQGVEDVESPIEGVVVEWAGDAKPVAEGIKMESRQVRRCGSRRCCFALSCCGFSMVAIITCCALFWPRDPQWKLVNLEILSEDAMMFFVMSMAGGMSSFNENSSFPDLLFHAEADISNPNLLGGTADSGHFQVFFQGQEIGTATSEPCSVKPQSSGIVAANSTVRLHYHTFQALTTHVLMNELQLTVQVQGGAWVQGPMGIRIKVGLECQLHCAVDKLFDYEARHEVVQSKECKYRYF